MPANLLKSRWTWIAAIVAALVGLYALLGFKVAPRIVRSQAIEFVRETYGRELAIGEVRINPFLLQLEVRDVALPDADGSPMLALRRLFVDFEASSLWHRAFVFKDVIVEGPDAHVVIRPDGSLNLADLQPAEPPEEDDSGIPRLWLMSLEVGDGKLAFEDRARAQPFARRFEPVEFTLKDFRTTPEGGGFQLSARSQHDESFDWKGRFSVEPAIASQGEFTVAKLRVPGVAEFIGDALPFGITSGLLDVAGAYRVKLGDALDLKAELPKIEITDLALRARGADADWVHVPSVVVSDTALALPEQTVTLAKVAVSDMKVQAWLAADGSINITGLFAPSSAAAAGAPLSAEASEPGTPPPPVAPAEPRAPPAEPAAEASKPWQVKVASIEVANAAIDLEDRMIAPVTKFAVAPVNVRVQDASLDLAKPVPVSLDAVINDHATLAVDGTVTPEPLAADLKLTLDRARMQILQPYVLPLADLTITGGLLAVTGEATLSPPEATEPDLTFAGDITVDRFASIDNTLREDFINFGKLQLKQLRYDMGPDAASIDQVLLDQPYARVIISEEQVINIAAVLDPKGTAAALEARRAKAAAEAAESPAEKRRREREIKEAEKREARARKERSAEPAPPPEPLPQETMPIRIREVKVAGGTMDFTDHFVEPDFSAKIEQLNGSMTGLSTDPQSKARIDFKGRVGEFSPVSIAGAIQPFAFDHYTDIGMKFENISLPIFNPYSGSLAGYNIAKGKLTTDLHYLIQDRNLDAQHKIRIDQLEWGEETATKGEATLPVKFATSLLKDRNGMINLDVPVTGTLDDPKLRIGPIVWQIIKNLIMKAVTAPFALFGAMFEGAEDAQFVDFAPGDSTLDATTTGRLAALAKGLVERPEVKLDVPLGTAAELDRPVLAERAWERQLAGAMGVEPGAGSATQTAFTALDPERKLAVLTAVVTKQTGAAPQVPQPAEPPEGTSRKDAKALEQAAAIEYLEKQARAGVVVTDAELGQLGEQRATAIQRALLADSGLEPTRVFLTRAGKVAAHEGKVRFELGLQ